MNEIKSHPTSLKGDASKKFTILVVDDEKANILTLMDILRPEYTVYVATSGQNAIEMADKHLPDIILLDIIMPDMDGYEVITILKKSEKTKHIPVIFITGLSSASDEEKGLAFGVADYIIKPFSAAIVKLRVGSQVKLIEQFRENEYDIMKYKLSNDALNVALWDMDVTVIDPVSLENRFTWSHELRYILGYSDDDVFTNTMQDLVNQLHPDDVKNTLNVFSAHFYDRTGKTPFDLEFRLRLKNGEYRLFHGFGTSLRNSAGIPVRIAGAVMDLTDKKQMEAERRKAETAELANRAKTEFLAKMSHEIRTPMNGIMGFAELALSIDETLKIKEYLGKIKDSTKLLLDIINDILDISKIEAGKMVLENIPFNLNEVFSRCQSIILPIIKGKALELNLNSEPLVGKKVLGDPVRLYQVLMNLLSNAVKFTKEGNIVFTSSIKNLDDDKISVYFEVKDNGIGMSREQIDKIFDPFVQADLSTTRYYGGTGLGLAIVKNIVELMGGTLSVQSAPGLGSTFNFEITFSTIDAPDDIDEEQGSALLGKPQFDAIVLICDDNPMNQEVICEHLALLGIRTIVADNGKIGVDMVQERITKNENLFDLIFMDMFMPVMDGLEAASTIKKMSPQTPIVAMTANVMASALEEYRNSGMPDTLNKPFTSQELWRILNKYLVPVEDKPAQEKSEDVLDIAYFENLLKEKLRNNFVNTNQTKIKEIKTAIETGDIKLAHRLVHSLKGNAGMLGKTALHSIAGIVENLLSDGVAQVPQENMELLEKELNLVLEELKLLVDNPQAQETPVPVASNLPDIIKKIEPMLSNLDPSVLNSINEIRAVSGTEEIAKHIENYDFEKALKATADFKKKFGDINV